MQRATVVCKSKNKEGRSTKNANPTSTQAIELGLPLPTQNTIYHNIVEPTRKYWSQVNCTTSVQVRTNKIFWS